MLEEWKTYKNIYLVSNFGRVKRVFKNGEHILKPIKRTDGYYEVMLHFNGQGQTWTLHRLVATVWLRILKPNEDAHHKNRLKCCNCVQNLEIIDQSQHAIKHNTGRKHSIQHKRKISEAMKGHKISQQTKQKISESRKKYLTQKKG